MDESQDYTDNNDAPDNNPPSDTPPRTWRDELSDEYKAAPALQSYKDLNALAKSHLELESLRGQSIRIPSQDAGEDDWNAFYGKLQAKVPNLAPLPNPEDELATKAFWAKIGVPEDETGYTLPEGVKPESVEGLNAIAKRAGLTSKQFQKLAAELATTQNQSLDAQRQEQKEQLDSLFYSWGMARDSKLNGINHLLDNSNAPEQLKEAVRTGNIGADFLAWADGLVRAIGSEGSNLTRDQSAEGTPLTPDEARAQVNEILRNREGAYWNPRDPQHKYMVNKVLELNRAALNASKRHG